MAPEAQGTADSHSHAKMQEGRLELAPRGTDAGTTPQGLERTAESTRRTAGVPTGVPTDARPEQLVDGCAGLPTLPSRPARVHLSTVFLD